MITCLMMMMMMSITSSLTTMSICQFVLALPSRLVVGLWVGRNFWLSSVQVQRLLNWMFLRHWTPLYPHRACWAHIVEWPCYYPVKCVRFVGIFVGGIVRRLKIKYSLVFRVKCEKIDVQSSYFFCFCSHSQPSCRLQRMVCCAYRCC